MLGDIKLLLRISNNVFDEELVDLIAACKRDMERVGINKDKIIDDDALIKRAVSLYCKANFGFNNVDGEKYSQAYEALRDSISMFGDYL